MSSVFISRDLTEDSPFREKLEAAGWTIHGESLLEFELLPFKSLPETDWVFFYSKNAVKYYYEGLQAPAFWQDKQVKMGPPRRATRALKYACFGPATAAYLKKHHGVEARFIGAGRPKATSEALLTMAAGESILCPRALHSRHSIKRYLKQDLQLIDLPVYDNRIRSDFELPHCDVLVFTSPMNATAYFSKYEIDPKQKVIAIGRTTARALNKLGLRKVKIAAKPRETALADLVLRLK